MISAKRTMKRKDGENEETRNDYVLDDHYQDEFSAEVMCSVDGHQHCEDEDVIV